MRVFVCLSLVLITSLLSVRTLAQSPVLFGLQAGLSWSNQSLRGESGFSPMRNLRIMGSIEKPVTKRFSVISELGYHGQGSRDSYFVLESEQLQYLEWNVQALEYLPVGGSDLFGSVGLYSAYGLSGESKAIGGAVNPGDVFDNPEYQRFDWGLMLQMGVKLPFGTSVAGGFRSALNNYRKDANLQQRYHNVAFFLTLGHTFRWKSKKH